MEDVTISINTRIKEFMKSKNISVTDMAAQLDITQQSLSRMLQSDDLKISTFFKITKVLKVSPVLFFEDMDNGYAEPQLKDIYDKLNELIDLAKKTNVKQV